MSEYVEAWNRINEYTRWRWLNRHRPKTDLESNIMRAYEKVLGRWLIGKIMFRVIPGLVSIFSLFSR